MICNSHCRDEGRQGTVLNCPSKEDRLASPPLHKGGIRVHKEGSLRAMKGTSRQGLCAALRGGATENEEGTSHHPQRERSAKKEEAVLRRFMNRIFSWFSCWLIVICLDL
jgi:hypothetical protein